MLTFEQIVESVKLMSRVGELRPGFMNKDVANLHGPTILNNSVTKQIEISTSEESECIHRGLKIDEKTGELYFDYL